MPKRKLDQGSPEFTSDGNAAKKSKMADSPGDFELEIRRAGLRFEKRPLDGKLITYELHAPRKPSKYGDWDDEEDEGPETALIFTHGAGGGIASAATLDFGIGFAKEAQIMLFEGTMNMKSRVKAFHKVMETAYLETVPLGGRSMGARAAVNAALEIRYKRPKALVLVSYPLSAGKTTKKDQTHDREGILTELDKSISVLFIIGTKDKQCDLKQLEAIRKEMLAPSWLITVDGADHGMSLTPKEAVEPMTRKTGQLAADWLEGSYSNPRPDLTLSWDVDAKEIKVALSGGTGNQGEKHIEDARRKQKAQDPQYAPELLPANKGLWPSRP